MDDDTRIDLVAGPRDVRDVDRAVAAADWPLADLGRVDALHQPFSALRSGEAEGHDPMAIFAITKTTRKTSATAPNKARSC
jgi:hypothetical protein